MALLLLFLSLHLWHLYRDYRDFVSQSVRDVDATVLRQYEKTGPKGTYTVLLLGSGALRFYTTSKEPLRMLTGRSVSLSILTAKITFAEFLGSFYAPGFDLALLPGETNPGDIPRQAVAAQHEGTLTQELYGALFFAAPVGRELREGVTHLGIAHLIALSGFHLGLLGAMIMGMLSGPYRFLQQRFFPFRNRLFDLGLVSALLLLAYLLFVNAPPSLVRAYGMLAVGFFLLWRHIRIVNFAALFLTLFILIVIIPGLMLSIGFWFSAAGVFFIFLILRHLKLPPWGIVVALHLLLFPLMLPVVHLVFEPFSPYQLLSIPLSLLFIPFYPLVMLLHLVGLGGLLDPWLTALFTLPIEPAPLTTPPWFAIVYALTALTAIHFALAFYLLIAMGVGLMLYALFF